MALVVAMVGGGQLARLTAPAALTIGVRLRALVESATSSAAQVLVDAHVGAPDSAADVARLLEGPPRADVLTFEHENVPPEVLDAVARSGVAVRPSPEALRHAQDKLVMRRRLAALGVPMPRWAPVTDEGDLATFLVEVGGTAVVKTARGGYDGKGVRVVTEAHQVTDWLASAAAGGPQLLVEEFVAFKRELAVMLARRPSGGIRCWPVVETLQVDGMCAEVVAPAPRLDPTVNEAAIDIAVRVAEELDVTGVMAVEMFEVDRDGQRGVVVNELAMRTHNSGHWTIDGAATSQFEQHLRAILDLPLGEPSARAPWTVMRNVLGGHVGGFSTALAQVLARDPGVRVHIYGKEPRRGRKLGHVCVYGEDLAELLVRARSAAAILEGHRLPADPRS